MLNLFNLKVEDSLILIKMLINNSKLYLNILSNHGLLVYNFDNMQKRNLEGRKTLEQCHLIFILHNQHQKDTISTLT
jgi:hypothetical protein